MIQRRARSLVLLAVALMLVPGATSVAAEDPLARRTFTNADQLMREGKTDQALREFEQVANAYPDSDVADDALYRIGAYYYPAESLDKLGGATPEALGKAKDLFTKITGKYPREQTAPRALLKIGLIALDPRNPGRSLDEAYAAFSGVVNIYPASDVVDKALLGAGYADFLAVRYDKSIGSFIRVAEEYPRGPAAAEARYFMGMALARQREYVRALEELQAGRDMYPDAPVSSRSFDLATRVFKTKILPELGGKALYALDPGFAPVLDPGGVSRYVALAVDANSVVHLADLERGTLLLIGSDGKLLGNGAPMPGARSIAIDATGQEIVAAGPRFRVGTGMIVPMRRGSDQLVPMEAISGAVGVGSDKVALLEENEILLYAGDPASLKLLYRDPEGKARLAGLVVGAEGKIYTIDRRGRRVLEIGPDGAIRPIPSPDLQEPIALAADDIGNLYILDKRARSIIVMTVEGKKLETIVSQPETPREFSDATALAIGPRAEIYVHDAKRRTIIRFR